MCLKVLFVYSGNTNSGGSSFIRVQAESLSKSGIEILYFPIKGKGLKGYFRAVEKLRLYLREHKVDIIHAHYSLSGWTAVLAQSGIPIVLSLMGDDANGSYIGPGKICRKRFYLRLATFLIQPFVKAIISKSSNIHKAVYRRSIGYIIPNGVQLDMFLFGKEKSKEVLGLQKSKKHILFLANPENTVKNFPLVKKALHLLQRPNVELLAPYPIPHEQVPKYLSSADVLVSPSFMEGSPNVVKEAMACNCPIVSTDVGDVGWVFGETEGCYIASFEPKNFATKLGLALDFSEQVGRTKGRMRIMELGLDAETIARRVIEVYKKVLS